MIVSSSYLSIPTSLGMSTSGASPGDKLRESTGKRPSLNPTIINTISEAILLRCSNDPSQPPLEVTPEVEPIEVAMAAGQLATNAIDKRAKSSTAVKGDESSAFNQEEGQLIAGRIVGVVMRWTELESLLIEQVKKTSWVLKYGEEASFGLTKEEFEDDRNDSLLKQRLKDDPLLRMCRAECLYALFLRTVEMPTMAKMNQIPADGATGVDFLDNERMEVLFPDGFE